MDQIHILDSLHLEILITFYLYILTTIYLSRISNFPVSGRIMNSTSKCQVSGFGPMLQRSEFFQHVLSPDQYLLCERPQGQVLWSTGLVLRSPQLPGCCLLPFQLQVLTFLGNELSRAVCVLSSGACQCQAYRCIVECPCHVLFVWIMKCIVFCQWLMKLSMAQFWKSIK